jgi:hypothetical protein
LPPHTVDELAGAQLPWPSHVPATHVPVQLPSTVPAPTGLQVPCPLTLQRWQVPQPEDWQQTPSVQNPEVHWLVLVQLAPLACGAAQTPPLQNELPLHIEPLQQSCPTPPQAQVPPAVQVRFEPHFVLPPQQG